MRHHTGEALAAKIDAPPVPITTAEQFFDCERTHIARFAKKPRRNLTV